MKLTFNPFPRNLASFVSCMAFALTALAGIEARGAIAFNADANQDFVRRLSSGIVVDWNSEVHILPVAGLEDEERPEVPYLSPDDLDCIAAAGSTEPGDFSDTNAADDRDYMEYKYGHYGNYGNSDPSPSLTQSADHANQDDYSVQTDDPSYDDNLTSKDANTRDQELTQGAETKEMPNGEGALATENSSNGTVDEGSDHESAAAPSDDEYYRYRYMPLQVQVGHNEGAKAQDDDDNSTNPKEGVSEDDDCDDSQMSGDDSSDDDSSDDAADDDAGESGAFTTAMLNIAAQAADEWSGSYGMKISDAGRLLGVNN